MRNLVHRPPRTQGRKLRIVRETDTTQPASPAAATQETFTDFVATVERGVARTERALFEVFRGFDFLASRDAWLSPEDEAALERCIAAYHASRRAIDAMQEAQLHVIDHGRGAA